MSQIVGTLSPDRRISGAGRTLWNSDGHADAAPSRYTNESAARPRPCEAVGPRRRAWIPRASAIPLEPVHRRVVRHLAGRWLSLR